MTKIKVTEPPTLALEHCRECSHFGFLPSTGEAYCLHKACKTVAPDGSKLVGLPRKIAAAKCPLHGGAGIPACPEPENP